MSRTLWLDHCLRMAERVRRLTLSTYGCVYTELDKRLRVELTLKEFEQLSLELNACQVYLSSDVPQGRVTEIRLSGVAFVPRDAEYTEKLRTDLRELHVENERLRGLLYDATLRTIRYAESTGRRALDRDLHEVPAKPPGTDSGRPA